VKNLTPTSVAIALDYLSLADSLQSVLVSRRQQGSTQELVDILNADPTAFILVSNREVARHVASRLTHAGPQVVPISRWSCFVLGQSWNGPLLIDTTAFFHVLVRSHRVVTSMLDYISSLRNKQGRLRRKCDDLSSQLRQAQARLRELEAELSTGEE